MRDMEDSGAGGDASSPATPRQGGAKASSQMPPEEPPATIIGRKVKWALDFLGAEKGDDFHRHRVLEDLDTGHVKGDEGKGLSGELDETNAQTMARVEAEAFQEGLRDDVMFYGDVTRTEVEKVREDFVVASIPAAEELEVEGVCTCAQSSEPQVFQ